MATTAKFWSKLTAASANKTFPRVISSGQGAYLTIGGKDYLNFCSSHYLGFAEEPRLKKAAKDAIDLYGLGTGYRTLAGTHAYWLFVSSSLCGCPCLFAFLSLAASILFPVFVHVPVPFYISSGLCLSVS